MFEVQDRARCKAIGTLLGMAGLPRAWTAEGPGPEARALRENGQDLTADQRMMLTAAWALWDGSESIRFAYLWMLDRKFSEALSALILATGSGPSALEGWLARYGARPVETPGWPGPPAGSV